jgi:hypothetical protein
LVVLLLPDGQVSVQDQFSPGYGRPNIDLHQNVEMVSTRSADGLWSVNFSRPLFTEDRQQDADLRECQHFLFLHSANPLMPGTGELRKHAETPVISENPVRKLAHILLCFGDSPNKIYTLYKRHIRKNPEINQLKYVSRTKAQNNH